MLLYTELVLVHGPTDFTDHIQPQLCTRHLINKLVSGALLYFTLLKVEFC